MLGTTMGVLKQGVHASQAVTELLLSKQGLAGHTAHALTLRVLSCWGYQGNALPLKPLRRVGTDCLLKFKRGR